MYNFWFHKIELNEILLCLIKFNNVIYFLYLGGIPISQDIFLKSLIKSRKRAELVRSLIDSAISTMKQEVLNGNL